MFCEYPARNVTFDSGKSVRWVSVIRRTVLNMNGDWLTCGHASGVVEPVTGIAWPLGILGLPSRS